MTDSKAGTLTLKTVEISVESQDAEKIKVSCVHELIYFILYNIGDCR